MVDSPLGLTLDKTLTITVNPALPTDIQLSNSTIVAAQPTGTTVGTLTTTDPNPGQTFTYVLTGTNAPLFDGRAQARSETNRLDVVVPSLVEAMFTGFPGHSGEVVKITIPTRPPARS